MPLSVHLENFFCVRISSDQILFFHTHLVQSLTTFFSILAPPYFHTHFIGHTDIGILINYTPNFNLGSTFVLALWMAGCVQNKNINFGDVTMKVVEGSVTPSGLTVRISNNTGIDINGGINYDFSIEKKEDDKWSPVKEIGDRTTDTETYIFQGERDLNINWSEIYGSLSAGEYRVVKFFYPSTEDGSYGTDDGFYLFAEFSIE